MAGRCEGLTEKGRVGLASCFTQRGQSPGVWLGSGMAGLDGLDAGDQVTAEQLQDLFGAGLHPLAQQRIDALHGPGLTENDYREASRLGTPLKIFSPDVSPFRVEVAKRLAALNLRDGEPSRSAGPRASGPDPHGGGGSSPRLSTAATLSMRANCPG